MVISDNVIRYIKSLAQVLILNWSDISKGLFDYLLMHSFDAETFEYHYIIIFYNINLDLMNERTINQRVSLQRHDRETEGCVYKEEISLKNQNLISL